MRPKGRPEAESGPTRGSAEGSPVRREARIGVDRPQPAAPSTSRWGSDAIASLLRALDFEFIALCPGASFRGLHDSLVNHLGNTRPEILLVLHEEHAVAIAHGYARVTGRPMAVALHSNVGLMHATMAIFNAWCDRVPMLLLGGVGPMDAMQRRPWVDWIHTARDLGALVRGYTKWDDQPASVPAALEAIMRACQITTTSPAGPVYVCLDAGLLSLKYPFARPVLVVTGICPQREIHGYVAGLVIGVERLVVLALR